MLLLVTTFAEKSYQELQFLVFEYVPSSEKTSVIFFGLDIAKDKMLMGFIYSFHKCLSFYQEINLKCRVGFQSGQNLVPDFEECIVQWKNIPISVSNMSRW